jgi:cysteine desulfurase
MPNKPIIYLDHAAATPVDPDVLRAMRPYFSDNFYNPSATYGAALEVRKALAAARAQVAHWLGSRPSEVIFTAGGTEANNLAIHGVMRRFPEANIVVSGIEHESVLAPARRYDCREVAVKADGRLDLDDLRRKIDGQTVMVSDMHANNEVGTIQSVREIAKVIVEKRLERREPGGTGLPLVFHTDACQAANYLDLHVARLGVDLLTVNGGKIYGPKQSGALYVKAGLQLLPLVEGGGQERGLRSGTENVASAVGLAAALDMVQTQRHAEMARQQALQRTFLSMVAIELPQAVINGSLKWRLPNNIHLTLPGQDNERLLIRLDEAGILAAAGSACSASDEEPSHVLRAMGATDSEARASLRFTMGRSTTSAMVAKTVQLLKSLA